MQAERINPSSRVPFSPRYTYLHKRYQVLLFGLTYALFCSRTLYSQFVNHPWPQ